MHRRSLLLVFVSACDGGAAASSPSCRWCADTLQIVNATYACSDDGLQVEVSTDHWADQQKGQETQLLVWPTSDPLLPPEKHQLCSVGFEPGGGHEDLSVHLLPSAPGEPHAAHECCDTELHDSAGAVQGTTAADCDRVTLAIAIETAGNGILCAALGTQEGEVGVTLIDDDLAGADCRPL